MSTDDPYSPDYDPPNSGPGPGVGDVGSGTEMGLDLGPLYKAGRLTMPTLASLYSKYTSACDDDTGPIGEQRGKVGYSGGSAVYAIMDLHAELQLALRRTTYVVKDVGETLVQIADDYARTDEAAAAGFDHYLSTIRGDLSAPPVKIPPAPKPPSQE